MVRIAQFEPYPSFVSRFATTCMAMFSKSYVRGREAGLAELRKIPPGEGVYSSDPERDALHRLWFEKSPELQVKGPTYKWLYEAVRSSSILEKKSFLKKIATPVMLAKAENDVIVSNKALSRAAQIIPGAEILELPDAKHEILMEVDLIRDRFLANFDGFIHRHVLSREDRLKKF
jgi:lysophospholipase